MPHVVTVTLNPAVDKYVSVERVAPAKKLRCSEPKFYPGGGGINVSRAMHELGCEAMALWTRGGPLGDRLARLLDDEAVSQHAISIAGPTRENFIVFESSSEEQYRFGMPGPRMTSEEVEKCLQSIRELKPTPDYLVLSGSLPPDAPKDLYATASRQVPENCRVILDASGEALKAALSGSVFLAKPNLRELGQLVGRDIETDAQVVDASQRLVGEGSVEVLVTSLGSGGATLVTADHMERVRAPTVKIRSKVGAGDSTVAGIVTGLVRDMSVPDAVRFGMAAGAAAVMTDGTSLCRREDTEALYREMQ